jgi:hypothetical protein
MDIIKVIKANQINPSDFILTDFKSQKSTKKGEKQYSWHRSLKRY